MIYFATCLTMDEQILLECCSKVVPVVTEAKYTADRHSIQYLWVNFLKFLLKVSFNPFTKKSNLPSLINTPSSFHFQGGC